MAKEKEQIKEPKKAELIALSIESIEFPKDMIWIKLAKLEAFRELGFKCIFLFQDRKQNVFYAIEDNIVFYHKQAITKLSDVERLKAELKPPIQEVSTEEQPLVIH